MRLVGLVGGTSWVSTQEVYALLNRMVAERCGESESARCMIYSLNFGDVLRFNETDDLASIERLQIDACTRLKAAGAEALGLLANTMHLFAPAVAEATGLPVIHIVDAVGRAIQEQGLTRVALLGTKYTMERPFFHERLATMGIETILPNDADREFIHRSIFSELTKDVFLPDTKAAYLRIIRDLVQSGAEGVILGCTEIPLLLSQDEIPVPSFNTTRIHAKAIVDFMLSDSPVSYLCDQ